MSILGVEFNSTQGHWETAPRLRRERSVERESLGGTLGETTASAVKGKPDSVSGVIEPRILL